MDTREHITSGTTTMEKHGLKSNTNMHQAHDQIVENQ